MASGLNISQIKELVFEDCRYPYVFQLNDGYRQFRLGFFFFELFYVLMAILLIYRFRRDNRFIIRGPSTFALYFIGKIASAFAFSLGDYSANKLSFINTCNANEFLSSFAIITTTWALTVRVLLYYNGYILYRAVTETEELKTERTSGCDQNVDIAKLFYKASHAYANKLCLLGLVASILLAVVSIVAVCSQPNIPPISCTYQEGFSPIAYFRFGTIGLAIITAAVVVNARTKGYPDPFGVLREIKVIIAVYLLVICVGMALLETSLHPAEVLDRKFTASLFASVFNVFVLTITVSYPAYLASKEEQTALTLEQVLSNPDSRKLFERQLRKERCLEVLNCYEAIQKFVHMFDENSDEVIKNLAHNIYRRFIDADSAEFPINISHKLRKAVTIKIVQDELSAAMFDEISQDLLETLRFELYPRFMRGPYYALFVGLSTEDTFERLRDII